MQMRRFRFTAEASRAIGFIFFAGITGTLLGKASSLIAIENNGSTSTGTDVVQEILRQQNCLSDSNTRLSCCRRKLLDYRKAWFHGGRYLQNLFSELTALDCKQHIRGFCKSMVYARFSKYSKLLYEYHCDSLEFPRECTEEIAGARNVNASAGWQNVTADFNSSEFTLAELKRPCFQVAAFQSASGGYGFYHEIIAFDIPFCSSVWCGFDAKTVEERGISHWDCIPSRCQAGVIVIAVISGLLSVAIVIANVTVIIVFTTTPKLRNSQALYKTSLAVADLVVGILVLPSIISSLVISYQSKLELGDVIPKFRPNADGHWPRQAISPTAFRFEPEYISFIGFSTSLSLLVSIYTLMMASLDRLLAIHSPLRYIRHKAKRVAVWASLTLWVIGILFSALPIFVRDMTYGVAASVLIVSIKTPGLIMYAIVVLIPLLIMWIATIYAYVITRKQALIRNNISVRSERLSNKPGVLSIEARLARTLATMVGTFTLCLLPAIVTLIVPHGISNIDPDYPRDFDPVANTAFTSSELLAILILMTNSLWNCFIYNARSKEFKRRTRHLYSAVFHKLCCKSSAAENSHRMSNLSGMSRKSTLSTKLSSPSKRSDSTPAKEVKGMPSPIVYRYTRENNGFNSDE